MSRKVLGVPRTSPPEPVERNRPLAFMHNTTVSLNKHDKANICTTSCVITCLTQHAPSFHACQCVFNARTPPVY